MAVVLENDEQAIDMAMFAGRNKLFDSDFDVANRRTFKTVTCVGVITMANVMERLIKFEENQVEKQSVTVLI